MPLAWARPLTHLPFTRSRGAVGCVIGRTARLRQADSMQALALSTLAVALAEIGDKTQLLALLLGARFRAPLPLIAGMALATLANHAVAGLGGAWLAEVLGPRWLAAILGLSFLLMALWMLRPDSLSPGEVPERPGRSVFLAALVAFFLFEFGDKTQLATVALAARLEPLAAVIAGTTLGLLLANAPLLLLGERVSLLLRASWARVAAAVTFGLFGVATLLELL